MWARTIILLHFVALPVLLYGQGRSVTRDSAEFYKKIQRFSEKNRFTGFVYRLIFRPIYEPEVLSGQPSLPPQYFSEWEGKVIRNIRIETLDPFGFDDTDTTTCERNFFEKAGNYLHISSFPLTIKNRLIFKKYDTFDSLRVRESMRLIRGQNYIREIFLTPVTVPGTDSVDIYIRTVDVWSKIITGTAAQSNFRINVKEKNFAGLGHAVQNDYYLDHSTGNYTNATDYYFTNIFNTYLNAVLHFDTDKQKNYNSSCSLERPFYSIFTKWAGGVYVQEHLNRVKMIGADSIEYYQNIRYFQQDHWLGKSWQLFRGEAEDERSTGLILSGRLLERRYQESISPDLDTLKLYRSETFYLSSIGLYKRKYKQDNYIFKFGFTEDVPVGRAFSFIAGLRLKGGEQRFYYGAKTFWGSYYQWGYFSANVEFGTFYRHSPRESCISGGITWFSGLLPVGRWKFRQFFKPQFTFGFNREPGDRLTLNNEAGIHGFNSPEVVGNQKVFFTLQTQSYAPWNVIGFRLGPYLVFSGGMVGTERAGFRKSRFFSQIGLGVLIKNDFLVMNSFEISVAYFPFIPGVGNDIVKPNPFRTSDVGFRDSDVGKPSMVQYH